MTTPQSRISPARTRLTALVVALTDESVTNEHGERTPVNRGCRKVEYVNTLTRQSNGVYVGKRGDDTFRRDLKSVGTFSHLGVNLEWSPNHSSRTFPPVQVWGDDVVAVADDDVLDLDAMFGVEPGTFGSCTAAGYI